MVRIPSPISFAIASNNSLSHTLKPISSPRYSPSAAPLAPNSLETVMIGYFFWLDGLDFATAFVNFHEFICSSMILAMFLGILSPPLTLYDHLFLSLYKQCKKV